MALLFSAIFKQTVCIGVREFTYSIDDIAAAIIETYVELMDPLARRVFAGDGFSR